jgi:hypothetical protein
MSMSRPLDALELDQYLAGLPRESFDNTHYAVWPDGRISEHLVKRPKEGLIGEQQGDVPLLWVNGSVQVTERYKAKGVRMLRDVFAADGEPERFEEYRQAIWARMQGYAIQEPEKLLPASVLRMRGEAATGVRTDKVFIPGQGLVDATDDNKATRVSEVLASTGMGRPTPADREAARKAQR